MDKITVHTPHGDVSIGDECETVNGDRVKFEGIETQRQRPYTVSWLDDDGVKCTTQQLNILPIQQPKPLEGLEQYEKFVELGLKGWSYSECKNGNSYPLLSALRILYSGSVGINQVEPSIIYIRPPRSTEWIRACDVTEETGR